MFFWGCDARHPQGNLLSHTGLQRIARSERRRREGSSRYQMPWQDGLIELHSYCVGFYPSEDLGIIYIRSLQRFRLCLGPKPLTPGKYEKERLLSAGRDQLLHSAKPLIAWVVEYERRIARLKSPAYRRVCWQRGLTRAGARPWLSPESAVAWFQCFLDCSASTPRPRHFHPPSETTHSPASHVH